MDRRLQDRMAARTGGEGAEMQERIAGAAVRSVELLRTADGTQELVLAGMAIEQGGEPHAGRAASVWRERWYRLWKRSQLPAKLIAFFDEINLAETPEAISAAVAQHALEMVGGYRAVVYLPDAEEAKGSESLALLRESRFGRAGLVVAPDFLELAQPWWHEVGAFLADPQISMVAHVPFGERGVLLVAERRSERVFDADDWEVLGTLAEQGARGLARVRKLEDAYELSLTDPLTGLANRRQMEVVLKHAWAAAERGEGLAVMMLDLDGFKALNDSYGHTFGDQILEIAADCIREEARGADAVIRYGGDEFMVILPRGTASSGRSLAGRITARLKGWVGISAGVAEYHPSYITAMDLINAADEDLYRNKATRVFARAVQPT